MPPPPEDDMSDRLQNIIDADGFGIAITGMTIVFVALVLISLFIAALPHMLERLAPFLPPEKLPPGELPQSTPEPEEDVVAAIGYVLHIEAQNRRS